jgi:hypothetical protein
MATHWLEARLFFPHGASTKIVTAVEMDYMTPAVRAVKSIDEVPEPFRSRIIAKAHEVEARLGVPSAKLTFSYLHSRSPFST